MQFHEAWQSCINNCLKQDPLPTRQGGQVYEVMNYSFTIWPTWEGWILNDPVRSFWPRYAAAETLWYLSGDKSVAPLLKFAPMYKKFTEPDGTAYGAYGHRLRHFNNFDQLEEAMTLLRRDPHTRRCVLSLWHPTDLRNQHRKDLPCTLTWQLMIREDRLHMTVTMRSNDIWLGMPNDIFANICCMRYIANQLNLNLGSYHHQVGSAHLYDKDIEHCHKLCPDSFVPTWYENEDQYDLDALVNGRHIRCPFLRQLTHAADKRRSYDHH